MLDLKFVRENPDIVKQNIKNKFLYSSKHKYLYKFKYIF